jgi:hypothetical protein
LADSRLCDLTAVIQSFLMFNVRLAQLRLEFITRAKSRLDAGVGEADECGRGVSLSSMCGISIFLSA